MEDEVSKAKINPMVVNRIPHLIAFREPIGRQTLISAFQDDENLLADFRSRLEATWPFMSPYCTAPYVIWQPRTAMLFFDNGLAE